MIETVQISDTISYLIIPKADLKNGKYKKLLEKRFSGCNVLQVTSREEIEDTLLSKEQKFILNTVDISFQSDVLFIVVQSIIPQKIVDLPESNTILTQYHKPRFKESYLEIANRRMLERVKEDSKEHERFYLRYLKWLQRHLKHE